MPHAALFPVESSDSRTLSREDADLILDGFRSRIGLGVSLGPVNLARGPLREYRERADWQAGGRSELMECVKRS